MYTNFIKKSGVITAKIARDFFLLNIGDKISTVTEYTEIFNASRGLVQNAIQFLESEHCIELKKSGKNGTTIQSLDLKKLIVYANWQTITGTMPIPLNNYLSSLASAICFEFKQSPTPFSFAYITGSTNRLKYLSQNIYDFIIVSKNTADYYIAENDSIEISLIAKDCIYSKPYYLYFYNKKFTSITDGMRVAVDSKVNDQLAYTKLLCKNIDVKFVEIPYTQVKDALINNVADFSIYREESWMENMGLTKIEIPELNLDNTYPCIITNKDNYNIKKLIQKYIHAENLADIQTKVLNDQLPMQFY